MYIYLISMGGLTGLVRVLPETIGTVLDPRTTHDSGQGDDFNPDWSLHAIQELESNGRILWQPDVALFWVKGQIEHQILARGELDQNKAKYLKREIDKLPQGVIKEGIIDKYGVSIEGAIRGQTKQASPLVAPTKPLPSPLVAPTHPHPIPTPSPPQPLRESKEKQEQDKYKYIPAQKTETGGEIVEKSVEKTKPPATEGKPRSPNQRILDGELKTAQKEFAKIFGGHIGEAKLCRLAFGRKGNGRECFEAVPMLVAFWKSLKPEDVADIEDPYAYSLVCARNPQTVERFKKQVFEAPMNSSGRVRGGEFQTIGELLEAR